MDPLLWATVTSSMMTEAVAVYGGGDDDDDDDLNATTTESAIRSTGTSLRPSDTGGGGPETRLDFTLIQRFASNRRVSDAAFFGLIGAYCLLIIIGTVGNSLVVYVVARQPAMRTARNVFVVNLAISDLLLCLITMPLTLMEILCKTWPLGNNPISCKMVGSLQAVSIFVSTLSITAIALDRYQLIVYPTKRSFQLTGALLALGAIWAVGIVLALPLFIVRTLQHIEIPVPNSPVTSVDYCFESWPGEKGRALYSIGSILVQYALPIVTVSVAHARICNKLRFRMASMHQQQQQQQRPAKVQQPVASNGSAPSAITDTRKAAREEQLRKTNILLMAIAVIFIICWMPMNIYNVVADSAPNFFTDNIEAMYIVYAVCHMFGMSSACANPLLYGWLNDNFRKEFQKIGETLRRKPSHVPAAQAPGAVRKQHDQQQQQQQQTVNGSNTAKISVPTAVAVVKPGAADTAVTIVHDSPLHLHNELTAVTHLVPDQASHLLIKEPSTCSALCQDSLQQL